jgi:uncharacterized protein
MQSVSRRHLVIVVLALVVANLIAHDGPRALVVLVVPAVAVLLVVLARREGVTWDEMGLGRGSLRAGAKFGLVVAGLVVLVVVVAAALPMTRQAFLDDRYDNGAAGALLLALVLIPLRTVIPEEVAFRGVLLAVFRHHFSTRVSVLLSSLLFGLWHVTSSLGLASQNDAIAAPLGAGRAGQALGVVAAVLATTVAGVVLCWLRLRSGSLLAPIALHWAVNGTSVLAAAAVWSFN